MHVQLLQMSHPQVECWCWSWNEQYINFLFLACMVPWHGSSCMNVNLERLRHGNGKMFEFIFQYHPHASTHPQNLTALCFFEVLHVTAHHAKYLRSELKSRSTELKYIAAIILMRFRRHDTRNQRFAHTCL